MKTSFLLPIISLLLICWQPKHPIPSIHTLIQQETDRIYPKLVELRRDLHAHPELAGKEQRTSDMISQYLRKLGLEVKTDLYGKSVIGILKGAKPGPAIAWRADMDAIRSSFTDPMAFKSTVKGVQHGCGHDVHMAIALGIAEVLSRQKANLKGTVYFIFQPEEETFAGAKGLLAAGLFKQFKPDEIYGLHVTNLPAGRIAVKPGEVFAWQRALQIKLRNTLTAEQLKALNQTIQNALARNVHGGNPRDIQLISDAKTGMLNPGSIFRDYRFVDGPLRSSVKNNELILEGYVYETQASRLKEIIPLVSGVIEKAYPGALRSVSFTQENATVLNHPRLTQQSLKTLKRIYGDQQMMELYGQAPYFNDDFAYFQREVPGVYFLLGGSNADTGMVAMNHAPGFQVDEECIRSGISVFSTLVLERTRL